MRALPAAAFSRRVILRYEGSRLKVDPFAGKTRFFACGLRMTLRFTLQ